MRVPGAREWGDKALLSYSLMHIPILQIYCQKAHVSLSTLYTDLLYQLHPAYKDNFQLKLIENRIEIAETPCQYFIPFWVSS